MGKLSLIRDRKYLEKTEKLIKKIKSEFLMKKLEIFEITSPD